jgi:hypothetical protein
MERATIDAAPKAIDAPASLDEAWDLFQALGRRQAFDELNALFRDGKAPGDLDGPTDGILVVPDMGSIRTPFVKAVSRVWMPWLGKRFFAAESRGDNRFRQSVRLPAKLLWPSYSTRPNGNERTAFDFETRVEAGGHDPGTQVLVIDYAPIRTNPDRLIRQIRDELVEVAPGAFLGKILLREHDEYRNIGFFALRRA